MRGGGEEIIKDGFRMVVQQLLICGADATPYRRYAVDSTTRYIKGTKV